MKIPPITVTPKVPPIKAATSDLESINPPPPSQSDNRVHIIPPDTQTLPRVKQRNRQQEATNPLPLKPMTPPIIAPNNHRYPFRHQRHFISVQYANAANHIYNLEANAVLNPLTGLFQEFCHLIKGPYKEIWKKSLANKFGRLAQEVSNRI